MKYIILPDSFKGSLTAIKFCKIAEEIISASENTVVDAYPICDGGEGSIDCLTALFHGKKLTTKATDGNLFIKNATYGYSDEYAFIAVSETSGLPQTLIKDPAVTTTVGMGEQILQAKHLGKKKIILCLGGSSTNDGGAGLVHALGGKFINKDGVPFLPTGGTLREIEKIELNDFYQNIEGMDFIALCDVDNPLLGPNGCSYTFAPQKGAKTQKQLNFLEDNMKYFAEKTAFLNVDSSEKGAGAAGGLGYCVLSFLKGKIISGIDFILDKIDFDSVAKDADYIITGEGKFDQTSLHGKVVSGVLSRAERMHKNVVVFCGDGMESSHCRVVAINDPGQPLDINIKNTESNLRKAIGAFLRTV